MPNASAVPASNVLAGETELRLGGSVVDGDGGSQNSLFLGLRIAGLGIRCMVGKLIAQVIAAGIIVTAYGVYWIGLEAVQGTVEANAVRLASTGTTYSHCNQWLADGTASLIQRKPGVPEATVHVQAQESPDIAENEPQACPWAGVLRWNPAAGFRVRKLRDLL